MNEPFVWVVATVKYFAKACLDRYKRFSLKVFLYRKCLLFNFSSHLENYTHLIFHTLIF